MRIVAMITVMLLCSCSPIAKDLRYTKQSNRSGSYDSSANDAAKNAVNNAQPNVSKLTEYCTATASEATAPGHRAYLQMIAHYQFASCDQSVAYFSKATELDFSGAALTDIKPLQYLGQLQRVNLNDNRITDLSPIKDNVELKYLELTRNGLADISGLKNLTNMIELGLSENQIVDISALAGLKNL
jgi:Leucine-rich repeat (LRR) protein